MELEVVAASLTYLRRRQRVAALDNVSLNVPSGSTLGVTGPSGAGKSSLLYVLSGLRVPSGGTVKARGIPLQQAMKQKTGCAAARLRIHISTASSTELPHGQ